jgi:GABA(A) receptor-associated protein
MKPSGSFKANTTLAARQEESSSYRRKFSPPRIPIILEHANSPQRPHVQLGNTKYVVPPEVRIGEFMFNIRKKIKFPAEFAAFLMVDDCIALPSLTMGEYYERARDDDGWLYIVWAEESTFGSSWMSLTE